MASVKLWIPIFFPLQPSTLTFYLFHILIKCLHNIIALSDYDNHYIIIILSLYPAILNASLLNFSKYWISSNVFLVINMFCEIYIYLYIKLYIGIYLILYVWYCCSFIIYFIRRFSLKFLIIFLQIIKKWMTCLKYLY